MIMNQTTKKKTETSKLILIVSYCISILLTVIVVVGAFIDKDMSHVVQIALASYVEVGG